MVSLISGIMFVFIFGLTPAMMRSISSTSIRFPIFLSRILAIVVLLVTIGAGVIWVGGDSVINRVEKTDFSGQVRSDDPASETFYQSRGWIWNDTLAMIRDNWMMGVGLGAYQTAYSLYSVRDGRLIVGQAHNDYLQMLADQGVVGAIAVLSFLVLLIRIFPLSIRHRDPMYASLALGCGGGVFAMLVHSLFDFNLQMPSNALLFLILVALISNTAKSAGRHLDEAARQRPDRNRQASQALEVWS